MSNTKPRSISTTPFFPKPFRVDEKPAFSRSPSVFGTSRSTSVRPYRHSSLAVEATESELNHLRYLKSVELTDLWASLVLRYPVGHVDDEDEIDLRTGRIVKDRGKIRQLEKREFGEIVESQDEPTVDVADHSEVPAVDEDEDDDDDPLGAWGDDVGLDDLFDEVEEEIEPALPAWVSRQDEEDMERFLRDNEAMCGALGDGAGSESEEETEEEEQPEDVEAFDDDEDRSFIRRRASSIVENLEDLFPSSEGNQVDSDDELGREDSDVEATQAVQVVEIVRGPRKARLIPQVVIPVFRRSSSAFTPAKSPWDRQQTSSEERDGPFTATKSHRRSSIGVTIDDLFTPEPEECSGPLTQPTSHTLPRKSSISRRSSSSSTGQTDKSLHTASLDSLFNTPPREMQAGPSRSGVASSSGSRVRWADQVDSSPVNQPSSPSKTLSRMTIATKSKGKARMIGERPFSDSSTSPMDSDHPSNPSRASAPLLVSPYLPNLFYHWTGIGPAYVCKACLSAGGIRADKAQFCKGRHGVRVCTFQRELRSQAEGDDLNIPSSRSPRIRKYSEGEIEEPVVETWSSLPPSSPIFDTSPERHRRSSSDEEDGVDHLSLPVIKKRLERNYLPEPSLSQSPILTHRSSSQNLSISFNDSHSSSTTIRHQSTARPTSSLSSNTLYRSQSIPSSSPAALPPSSPPVRLSSRRRSGSRQILPLTPTASTSPAVTTVPRPKTIDQLPVDLLRISARRTPSSLVTRSSSSDHIPITLPRRIIAAKSRQSMPPPLSIQRLNPLMRRSVPIASKALSSTQSEDNESDDELLLRDTPEMSPPSSPVLSSEDQSLRAMSIRARDANVELRNYSGKLPSEMVDALSGSMRMTSSLVRPSFPTPPRSTGSTSSNPPRSNVPTLGSINTSGTVYALQTPPRSSDSNRSSSWKPAFYTYNRSPSSLPPSDGRMLPPPVPKRTAMPVESSNLHERSVMSSPSKRPGSRDLLRVQDSEERSHRTASPAKIRARSSSFSFSQNQRTLPSSSSLPNMRRKGTPFPSKKPGRDERILKRLALDHEFDDAGLEWGMDEDVGDEVARSYREGSIVKFLS